jgi:hypothetical protein
MIFANLNIIKLIFSRKNLDSSSHIVPDIVGEDTYIHWLLPMFIFVCHVVDHCWSSYGFILM